MTISRINSYCKKIIFLLLFIGITQSARAQFELKANPILLLFGVGQVSGEAIINDDFGMGVDMLIFEDFFAMGIPAKFYFNPKWGADRFNAGAFLFLGLSGDQSGVGGGFLVGYKLASKRNVVLDFDIGIGRGTGDDLDIIPYGKLVVGYRFRKTSQE